MNKADESLLVARRWLMERLRREVPDKRVVRAMEDVPRECFVPKASRHMAYEDVPQSIGEGQTISQPYIIGLMVSALELKKTDKVLEVGTGSGYQAAILGSLAREVFSVERLRSLAEGAISRLASLGYSNVRVVMAESVLGWKREAPYDAIVVAAGAPKLPRELIEQLVVGGRLVVPVGGMGTQELVKASRTVESYTVKNLGACRFVPLIGDGAWPETGESAQGLREVY